MANPVALAMYRRMLNAIHNYNSLSEDQIRIWRNYIDRQRWVVYAAQEPLPVFLRDLELARTNLQNLRESFNKILQRQRTEPQWGVPVGIEVLTSAINFYQALYDRLYAASTHPVYTS